MHDDYAYIGSRTDGGHAGQPQGGLMVVDISQAAEARRWSAGRSTPSPGESTRELRVWRSQDMLIVLNTNCGVGPMLHHCTHPSISNIRFYDIGGAERGAPAAAAASSRSTRTSSSSGSTRRTRERALIFAGNAASTCGTRGGAPSCPFSVWDISSVPEGERAGDALQRAAPVHALPGRAASRCRSRPAACTR